MGIRSRLIGLLAIPLAGLLVFTGIGVVNGAVQASDAAELDERTALALSVYRLVDDLQTERETLVENSSSTPEQRAAIDATSAVLSERAATVGGNLEQMTQDVLRRVEGAQSVSSRELGGRVALTTYSAAIDGLLDIATLAIDPAGAIDGAPAATVDFLARSQAATAQERDLVVLLDQAAGEEIDAQAFQDVMRLASAQESYNALAASAATESQGVRINRVGFAMSAADAVRRDVFTATGVANFQPWVAGLDQRVEELSVLQGDAETEAIAAVDDLAASSRVLFVTAALGALAIVLISILLLRRATRSISRPLQDLAVQAEDVARVRLPEAVRAQQHQGGDELHLPALRATGAAEVYEVAGAFNEVQDTALRLAGEQAALRVNQAEALTNLGRRNQTLLARQLDFISSLETRETDPVFLDHLFKLDHLASRMRRNAESLLILAGSETPRRRRAPAKVAEVVRAAMSEVEDFERVRIGHLRDSTLAGPVVIDLVHLLAELIENALGFSPPETTVEIDGRALGQGGYQFAVIDHGVGMGDVELVAANQRISGLDELEGMPTRYLGQYVVAKLAAKTGAMVKLQPSSGGRGVTALVILPATALVGQPDRTATAGPPPGSRAAREQGPAPFAPGTGLPGVAAADAGHGLDAPSPVDLTQVEREGASAEAEFAVDEPSPVEPLLDAAAFDADTFDADTFDADTFDADTFDADTFDASAFRRTPHTADFNTPEPIEADFDAGTTDPFELVESVPLVEALEVSSVEVVEPEPLETEPTETEEVEDDPWVAFRTDAADDTELPSPPPLNGDLPVAQPDWTPVEDDPAVAQATAPDADSWVPAERQLPDPFSAPVEAAEVGGGLGGRSGGLLRRVPGATLADARPGDDAAEAAPVDRSADAVRSMLSSFQAGRTRGRGAPADATDGSPQTSTDEQFISEVQDGRSSK